MESLTNNLNNNSYVSNGGIPNINRIKQNNDSADSTQPEPRQKIDQETVSLILDFMNQGLKEENITAEHGFTVQQFNDVQKKYAQRALHQETLIPGLNTPQVTDENSKQALANSNSPANTDEQLNSISDNLHQEREVSVQQAKFNDITNVRQNAKAIANPAALTDFKIAPDVGIVNTRPASTDDQTAISINQKLNYQLPEPINNMVNSIRNFKTTNIDKASPLSVLTYFANTNPTFGNLITPLTVLKITKKDEISENLSQLGQNIEKLTNALLTKDRQGVSATDSLRDSMLTVIDDLKGSNVFFLKQLANNYKNSDPIKTAVIHTLTDFVKEAHQDKVKQENFQREQSLPEPLRTVNQKLKSILSFIVGKKPTDKTLEINMNVDDSIIAKVKNNLVRMANGKLAASFNKRNDNILASNFTKNLTGFSERKLEQANKAIKTTKDAEEFKQNVKPFVRFNESEVNHTLATVNELLKKVEPDIKDSLENPKGDLLSKTSTQRILNEISKLPNNFLKLFGVDPESQEFKNLDTVNN
jgi:hypothetical protein